MNDTSVIAFLGVITSLIAVITPIIKLNANLVRLNANFENMMKTDEIRDRRIEKHGNEIDEIIKMQISANKIIDSHERRISKLEENQE